MDSQSTSASTLLGISALLKQVWATYKRHLPLFLQIMLIPALASVLFEFFQNYNPISWILLPVYLVLFSYGHLVVISAIKNRANPSDVFSLYKSNWRLLFSYIVLTVLVTLAIALGFLLLIIPGIIFAVWFSVSLPVLVAEGKKGSNAMKASKAYVKGRWAEVFWRMVVMGIISTIFIVLVKMILLIVFGYGAFLYTSAATDLIMMMFIVPFQAVFAFLLYENLRDTKNLEPAPEAATPVSATPEAAV